MSEARQKIIMGNWKMHGDRTMIASLIDGLLTGLPQAVLTKQVDCVVMPPYPYLSMVCDQALPKLGVGAQTLSAHEKGAHTGEVSGDMIRDVGCDYVIIGHSERRHDLGESDEQLLDQVAQALRSKLVPVFCIGETLEDYQHGRTDQVLSAQLSVLLDRFNEAELSHLVLAYEPVWAIGTGKSASAKEIRFIHAYLRETLAARSKDLANTCRIVYGGSVNPGNAQEIFTQPNVDGALVGGASLKSADFLALIDALIAVS